MFSALFHGIFFVMLLTDFRIFPFSRGFPDFLLQNPLHRFGHVLVDKLRPLGILHLFLLLGEFHEVLVLVEGVVVFVVSPRDGLVVIPMPLPQDQGIVLGIDPSDSRLTVVEAIRYRF